MASLAVKEFREAIEVKKDLIKTAERELKAIAEVQHYMNALLHYGTWEVDRLKKDVRNLENIRLIVERCTEELRKLSKLDELEMKEISTPFIKINRRHLGQLIEMEKGMGHGAIQAASLLNSAFHSLEKDRYMHPGLRMQRHPLIRCAFHLRDALGQYRRNNENLIKEMKSTGGR